LTQYVKAISREAWREFLPLYEDFATNDESL
jgi:hypothetical protein